MEDLILFYISYFAIRALQNSFENVYSISGCYKLFEVCDKKRKMPESSPTIMNKLY